MNLAELKRDMSATELREPRVNVGGRKAAIFEYEQYLGSKLIKTWSSAHLIEHGADLGNGKVSKYKAISKVCNGDRLTDHGFRWQKIPLVRDDKSGT